MVTTTAQVKADLQPIFLRQQDIQDDQVVGRQFCEILSFLPIIGDIDTVPFMGQIHLERRAEAMVVFYHKQTHEKSSLSSRVPMQQRRGWFSPVLSSLRLSHIKITIR